MGKFRGWSGGTQDHYIAGVATDREGARAMAESLRADPRARSVKIYQRTVRAAGIVKDVFVVIVERHLPPGTPQGAYDHAAGYPE